MENSKNSTENGFECLLNVHTNALKENSEKVVEILERLSEVKLDPKSKRALKRIKSELRSVDKRLDSLDKDNYIDLEKTKKIKKVEEEENWFEF